MAANKLATVFMLCILLCAISHTAEAAAKADKCENDCYKKCGVDESSWSPCPFVCYLENCDTNYSEMAVQSASGGRKFPKPASAPSGSMASSMS